MTAVDLVELATWGAIGRVGAFDPALDDAVSLYRHYRGATGEPVLLDYAEGYREDTAVKNAVDAQIATAQSWAQRYARDGERSFRMTGGRVLVEPDSENWQKTLGAHSLWAHADVRTDGGRATMRLVVTAEDYYNYNPGEADIATGIENDANRRFAELGWAAPFPTVSTLAVHVEWMLGDLGTTTAYLSPSGVEDPTREVGPARSGPRGDETGDISVGHAFAALPLSVAAITGPGAAHVDVVVVVLAVAAVAVWAWAMMRPRRSTAVDEPGDSGESGPLVDVPAGNRGSARALARLEESGPEGLALAIERALTRSASVMVNPRPDAEAVVAEELAFAQLGLDLLGHHVGQAGTATAIGERLDRARRMLADLREALAVLGVDRTGSLVLSWGTKPRPLFQGVGPLYLGLELEVVIPHRTRGIAALRAAHLLHGAGYPKYDTHGGIEVVTHPMSYRWAIDNFPWGLLADLKRLDGSPAGVGLHVHVSRDAFDAPSHVFRWLVLLHRNQAQLKVLSRRPSALLVEHAAFTAEDRSRLKDHALRRSPATERNRAINTRNEDTFEVRFFAGSLDPQEVQAALGLVAASVEYTRALSVADVVARDGWGWPAFAEWVAGRPEYAPLARELTRLGIDPAGHAQRGRPGHGAAQAGRVARGQPGRGGFGREASRLAAALIRLGSRARPLPSAIHGGREGRVRVELDLGSTKGVTSGHRYRVYVGDHLVGIYKPRGLHVPWRWSESTREIAAAIVAEELGWAELVPRTVEWHGPAGRGSVQFWLHDAERGVKPVVGTYAARDVARAGVLDYVIANQDRNRGNFTRYRGSLRLIDHGEAFPMFGRQRRLDVRSMPFLDALADGEVTLSPDLLADIAAVDLPRLAGRLFRAGLPGRAVRLTVARIRAVREQGTVTPEMRTAVRGHPDRMPPSVDVETDSMSIRTVLVADDALAAAGQQADVTGTGRSGVVGPPSNAEGPSVPGSASARHEAQPRAPPEGHRGAAGVKAGVAIGFAVPLWIRHRRGAGDDVVDVDDHRPLVDGAMDERRPGPAGWAQKLSREVRSAVRWAVDLLRCRGPPRSGSTTGGAAS
jgi:hypothetical protein